jgi:hypothetical protein
MIPAYTPTRSHEPGRPGPGPEEPDRRPPSPESAQAPTGEAAPVQGDGPNGIARTTSRG